MVYERVLLSPRLPALRAGHPRAAAGVATPLPGLVLAGDGVRIDLPVALMERAATTGWTAANKILVQWGLVGHDAVYGSHPGPFGAAALPGRSRKAFATMNIGDNVAATLAERLAAASWFRAVAWAEQRPTYRDASPAIIDAALDRSQRRPTGNWYAFAASRDVAVRPTVGIRVAGVELVAWRDRRIVGCMSARAVARTSAPTSPPRPCRTAP